MTNDLYEWINITVQERGEVEGGRYGKGGGVKDCPFITRNRCLIVATKLDPAKVIVLRDENKKPARYTDTPEIIGMRNKLNLYNEFLEDHWIDLLVTDDEFAHVLERRSAEDVEEERWGWEKYGRHLDLSRRRLFRVFNVSFDHGGRFYGGWWQGVPRVRRPFITINGQPTRELDYKGLHLAMIYSEAGERMVGDPYVLDGIGPEYRRLVKLTLMKLVNAKAGQQVQRPMDRVLRVEEDELGRTVKRKRKVALPLPPGMTWPELQEAIIQHHPAIGRYLRSGAGIRLQRKDSDIAEAVTLSMMRRDILALPIHDSLIVDYRYVDLLREEMARAYQEHMGTEIGIKADRSIIDEIDSTSEEAVNAYVAQKVASDGYQGYRERGEAFWGYAGQGRLDVRPEAQAA